jgi:hypothetical protein
MMAWNIRDAYLDLLKRALTDTNHFGTYAVGNNQPPALTELAPGHPRWTGEDLPALAETLIGVRRMESLRSLIERVLNQNVAGDIAFCGVWRGGAAIYAAGILASLGVTDRTIFVCDTFEGPPPPDPQKYPLDEGATFHTIPYLIVKLPDVMAAFNRYDLMTENVQFVQGLFRDTLPPLAAGKLALVYAEGMMYGPTMETLANLYDSLSPGGVVFIDRYLCLGPSCQAINDFRRNRNISVAMHPLAGTAAYWCKP